MATGTSFTFTWNGTNIAAQLEAAIEAGMDDTGAAIVTAARTAAPVLTGEFRDGIDYRLERTRNSATVVIEAKAPHSIYVILGTSRMPARDPIRPAIDREAPRVPERVRANLGSLR